MTYTPAEQPDKRNKYLAEVEEQIQHWNFCVKRIRFAGGQGKVYVMKYDLNIRQDTTVPFIIREYITHNYSDMRLYDKLSLMLNDSKSGDEFEQLLEGIMLQNGPVLPVYKLDDVLQEFHVVKEL